MSSGPAVGCFLHQARRWFRWFRAVFLLVLLVLAAVLVVVNRVAVPKFLATRIQAVSRAYGAEVRFERIVWRWYRGFVARNVSIRPASEPNGPRISSDEVVFNLKWSRLLTARTWQVDSLEIIQGRAVISLSGNDNAPDRIDLQDIFARVRFGSGKAWAVDEFRARFLGSTLHAAGVLTNAQSLSRLLTPDKPSPRVSEKRSWQPCLSTFVRLWQQIQFGKPPEFRLHFAGDIERPETVSVDLRARIPVAHGPWGCLTDTQIELTAAKESGAGHQWRPRLNLSARRAETVSATLDNVNLDTWISKISTNEESPSVKWILSTSAAVLPHVRLHGTIAKGTSHPLAPGSRLWHTDLDSTSESVRTDWGSWRSNMVSARITHSLTNFAPVEVELRAGLQMFDCELGKVDSIEWTARVEPAQTNANFTAGSASGWWTNLASRQATFDVAADGFASERLPLRKLKLRANWLAPELRVQELEAMFSTGVFVVKSANYNVENRVAKAGIRSEFDLHSVAPLLGEGPARWLAQFGWKQPPLAEVSVSAVMPLWTNSLAELGHEFLRVCELEGILRGRDVSYRDVHISSGSLRLSLSNEVLRLTDFTVVRPEGEADLDYQLHTRTREFRWHVKGSLNAWEIGPAVDRDAPKLLRFFEFAGPTKAEGQISGCWAPPKRIGGDLLVHATNFTFRGEAVDETRGLVHFTNDLILLTDTSLRIGTEWIKAPAAEVRLDVLAVALTNLECRIDPRRVARVVGSNVVETLRPYRFDVPPLAHVNGRIAFPSGGTDPDIRFDVAGGPFHFWRLNASEVAGVVHWGNDFLLITNLAASFHQGRLTGEVGVRFQRENDADIRFSGRLLNANLTLLAGDLLQRTNRLEGTISGSFSVVRGRATDARTWSGRGRVEMRDGLLWDLPIFGILSPVLNAVVPGLGNSKARSANASFALERGAFETSDLTIEAGLARLRYHGITDLDGNVDARVEAEILASTPLLGPFISLALSPLSKAFIYKVGGTLDKPQLTPVYVPKFLMPILRPFHTLKSLFPADQPASPKPGEEPGPDVR